MTIKHVSFFGGRVHTRPKSLRFKRGDEVRFSLSDRSLAGVTLSFSSPSPFGQSSLLLHQGEQATLTVLRDVAPGSGRVVATPHAQLPPGGGIPGPIVIPGPVGTPGPVVTPGPVIVVVPEVPPVLLPTQPPGTMSGDVDVTPDVIIAIPDPSSANDV